MPAAVKASENMSKHLTKAEREVREQAEAAVLPDRGRAAKLKKPVIVSSSQRAHANRNPNQ